MHSLNLYDQLEKHDKQSIFFFYFEKRKKNIMFLVRNCDYVQWIEFR